MTVAGELVRYRLRLVGVEEVRWDKELRSRTMKRRGLYFVLRKTKRISSIGNRIFCTAQNSVSS
jgi:hypothetical protein